MQQGLEWKVHVLLFFPQAPQGCDPADSHSSSAELLLSLPLVLLALGKPLWLSLSLCIVHAFKTGDIIYPFHFSVLFQAKTVF